VIAGRPLGRALSETDFRLEADEVAAPADGQVLLRTLYLACEPSQKSVMENISTYSAATDVGSVMPGIGIGEVVESRSRSFAPGALAYGPLGWREFATVDAALLEPVPDGLPPTAVLGVTGVTGLTAYVGLLHVGMLRAGDTLVVSGAAGAVGSVAGQIGKIAGCRVIGIAGGAAKCARLVEELGFDAAIDYRAEKVRTRLRELCPDGIDVFFDNVGGETLNDALARLAPWARVVVCGGISRYNADPRKPEQLPPAPQNYFNLVHTNSTMRGFLVHDYAQHFRVARRRLADWVRDGRLRQVEDVLDGFENAPRALLRLFAGQNVGKQLLRA
jgi:hypothetical protein